MVTPTRAVFWTDDERQILVEAIIEKLKEKKVPEHEWHADGWLLMEAQIEYLTIPRRRITLTEEVVNEFNKLVSEAGQKRSTTYILERHHEYVKTHGISPIDHAGQMLTRANQAMAALENTKQELTKAQCDLVSMQQQRDEAQLARDNAHRDLTATESKLAANTAAIAKLQAQLDSRANVLTPVVTPVKATKHIPMFIVSSKLTPDHKLRLKEINPDILYLENKDRVQDVKRKAVGRVVFTVEGHVPSEMSRVGRHNAKEHHHVQNGAGTAVQNAVQERMMQEAA